MHRSSVFYFFIATGAFGFAAIGSPVVPIMVLSIAAMMRVVYTVDDLGDIASHESKKNKSALRAKCTKSTRRVALD